MSQRTATSRPSAAVCAVVVTYADRVPLVVRVVQALQREGVQRIWVVDNGSMPSSRVPLQAMAERGTIWLHSIEFNAGSAAGFAKGLSLAAAEPCDFIWVLDDDTEPQPGALAALLQAWNDVDPAGHHGLVALSSLREDRPNFIAALTRSDPDAVLPPRNSFVGFHVGQLAVKAAERALLRPKPSSLVDRGLPRMARISAAAYGGWFCRRNLVERLGLPDERYVLYTDDFDYTHGLTRQGGEIWLVSDSRLVDLEASYCLPVRKRWLYHSVFDAPRETQVYYGVRNLVHFARQHLVDRPAVYWINRAVFLMLMRMLAALRRRPDRLTVLRQAVLDGEAGRLGRHPSYPI